MSQNNPDKRMIRGVLDIPDPDLVNMRRLGRKKKPNRLQLRLRDEEYLFLRDYAAQHDMDVTSVVEQAIRLMKKEAGRKTQF